jgi:ubiquinone/menaquinone biosynthesis C-methylase UbiE
MPKQPPSDGGERDRWERILSTDSEAAFRDFIINQVSPQQDESVLSVGCGPGFETAALARYVGVDGTIIGIDVSEEVLAAARDRCGDLPQASFAKGDIVDLPVADESYDLAMAKQVLYAISDIETALDELFRVIAPGGRVAVTAGDRRTHVKHTPTDRMQLADDVYRAEINHSQLGTRLIGQLPEAGFTMEEITPRAKIKTEFDDQIEQGIDIQRRLLKDSDVFDSEAVDAWEQEMRELNEMGQFLSCSTSFLYIARKPE